MKLDIGTVIERYTVEGLLGAGGTAMVYRVKHAQLKREYALKVLTITSDAIRERMLREGRVQASLTHLNVVRVTDVLDIDGKPGLVMEYIAGPSLELALQRYRMSNRDAETLFLGILAGVRHAHEHGLVHRDLKPANVLLERSSTGFVPKVTDFGLAKVLVEDSENIGQTRQGIAMGTPSYMAPEQIRDARTVDQRADIFSLGCILYELVCRRRAFRGDEALIIYNAITRGRYVPPRKIVPELPDRIDQAIRGALQIDRERRIPDCQTLLAVLRGELSWQATTVGEDEIDPAALDSDRPDTDAPELPVAVRGPAGETPGPPPVREEMPRLGIGSASGISSSQETDLDALLPDVHVPAVEGTLDASDSLVGLRKGEASMAALTWLLVGAAGAVVVVSVVFAIVGLASYVYMPRPEQQSGRELSAGLPVLIDTDSEPLVAEPPPAEAVPTPSVVSRPAAPAPASRPAVLPSAPAPAPTIAVVKILSVPPTASVSVGGSKARTPAKLRLPLGRYQVTVAVGGQQERFPIDVRPGANNKWCFVFADSEVIPGACPR